MHSSFRATRYTAMTESLLRHTKPDTVVKYTTPVYNGIIQLLSATSTVIII